MSWYWCDSVRESRPCQPLQLHEWDFCVNLFCVLFLCLDVPALEWRLFWSSELFFYMLILYQIVLMWYCSRCMYTCSCVHAFFYFFFFLFNLLMAHIGLLNNFFSLFSYSPVVWEESTLMPLYSILEDLRTAKSSGCEGEVFMCLVCCDLNDRWIYNLLLSFVCYPGVVLWFVTWFLWCFYLY